MKYLAGGVLAVIVVVVYWREFRGLVSPLDGRDKPVDRRDEPPEDEG